LLISFVAATSQQEIDDASSALRVNGMFAVEPKKDCPHVYVCVAPMLEFELSDACVDCGNTGENWVCLACSKVYCSRYVKGHMAAHQSKKGLRHSVCFSFSDFSFWFVVMTGTECE
jgi:uncharacterized UBP type Zn finger protein